MDDTPPSTRRSARARRGREVFSPDLGGGTGSTRWSSEGMRRTASGSGGHEGEGEKGSRERGGGVEGGGSGTGGGTVSPEKERRVKENPREKGKQTPVDPPIRSTPNDVPPVQRPPPQAQPTTVSSSGAPPSRTTADRSPSIELIDSTPRNNNTTTRPPSARQPVPEQQPSQPYSRAIPPKVKLRTALQPVIHDLSGRKRMQAIPSGVGMSRTGPGVGSGAAATSAAASSGTPRTRQTGVQDPPNAPAAKSTPAGGPSVPKPSEIRKSPSSTRTAVKRAAETTATTSTAGRLKVAAPTATAPAEPTATDALFDSTDVGMGMDLDVVEEPIAAGMTVPPAADPRPASSADPTPVPSKSSARVKAVPAPRSPAAPGSSTQTTSSAHPESRAKPPPAMRKASQSAASAAAAAVIAAWNARFSPQVDDTFFSPNARSTAHRSTSPAAVSPSAAASDRARSPVEGTASAGTVMPSNATPTSPAVHGARTDVIPTPESPGTSPPPPPIAAANRTTTPTPQPNTPSAPVTSPPPPPPPPPQVAAAHARAAPIGPKKRFSSMMQPVIHDLSSKSRTTHGVPERMGGGSGRALAVSDRAQGRLDGDGVAERKGDVQATASGNGKVTRKGSAAGPSTTGKAKDLRPNGMAEPVASSSKRKELRGTASTMPEKDTDSPDRQQSRRNESRRVNVRSPSPPRRRKNTDRLVDDPRSPSPAAEDRRTPPRSRRTARPSESPAKRTNDVDPYAEELRVDPASDEDYAPPSARKEARGPTWREEESPAKPRKDVSRRDAKGGASAVPGPTEPVSAQERGSRRLRGRADMDQDMEESGMTLTADQDPSPSTTREPSRQKEKRVAETSVRRKDADPAPEEPEASSTTDGQPPSPSSRSQAALMSISAPERTEPSRSKESRRPAPVARSRAMRMEAEQETSSRTRLSAQKSRDEVTSVMPEREEVPQRSGSRPSATHPPAPTQQESIPVSPPRPIVDVHPASQSPATLQRTQLPPPPAQRSANANFQDYLRRSQIGKKGGGPSRQLPVVEKRKRVEETREVVLPREISPPQEASPPLEVSPIREPRAPQEASPTREVSASRKVIAPPAPEKPINEPESTDDWIMEIDTEPVLPSPRLPTPPPISEPLPPPPPLVKEKTKSTLTRTSALTKSKEPLTKAALLAEKQAQIEKLLDEHDTVLREMFHLEKFKTMVIGYDPRIAKQETSNVWKEWQAPFDLIDKYIISQTEIFAVDPEVGASSRRTTRRKMAEQVNRLPLEVLLGIPPSLRIASERPRSEEEDAEMEEAAEKMPSREVRGGSGKPREKERLNVVEKLPPPPRTTRELSKRKPTPITVESATPTPTTASLSISPVQARPSKKRRVATPSDVADEFQMDLGVSHRPTSVRLSSAAENGRSSRSRPQPVQVYNLPPAPPPRYTCPEQFPAHRPPAVPASHVIFASPKLTAFPSSSDVASVFPSEVLKSFVMLEEDGDSLTEEDLREMAEAQVDVIRKVIELQVRGRRTLPDSPDKGNTSAPRNHAPRTRHDAVVDHALRFRTWMLRDQKHRISQKKKIVKAVEGYWSGIASVEERKRKDEERRIRTGAKEVAKLVKSKWKLAVKVIRMRKQVEAKAEQERLGREHLKKILERSENMLKKRKRAKSKPTREGSQTSTAFPESSPEPTIFELFAGDMADDEEAHVTDDEAPANMDAEEEEAAKVYESLTAGIDQSPVASISTLRTPIAARDELPDDGIYIDVPELTEAERSTYSRDDLDAQMVELGSGLVHSVRLQHSQSPTVLPPNTSPTASHRLAPISEDPGLEPSASHVVNKAAPKDDSIFGMTADLEEEDRRYDEEMLAADAEIEDSDDEDEGLRRDADMPIEELLARYNYKVDETSGMPMQVDDSASTDNEIEREDIDESVAAASEASSESGKESITDGEQAAALPFLLRADLRPYQRDGLTWLAKLYREQTNAILADEMGLGKTLQTIALLAHLACDHQEWGPHLIIVPTSVILNWEMEFKKFLPGFKILTYYGTQQERKDKRKGWFAPHSFQVCITSYQIAIADQAMLRRRQWQYLILDEAHNIKNFKSQRWQTLLGFKSERRLLLTGTPLQNNLMELWSLMYFLMPSGLSDDLSHGGEFANHQEFSEWFSNPMDKAIESGDGISPEARETVNRLHVILRPFILRRLKADVEKQLPAKFEHTLYCNLSKRQQYLYDEFMSRSSTRQSLVSGGYLGIANCLMQLRKVCNHPDLFEVRPIETSFAMKQSVVSPFLGSFAKFQGVIEGETPRAPLVKLVLHQHSGITTSLAADATARLDASDLLPFAGQDNITIYIPPKDTRTVEGWKRHRAYELELSRRQRWARITELNRNRCSSRPVICLDMLRSVTVRCEYTESKSLGQIIRSNDQRLVDTWPVIQQFAVIPPRVTALEPSLVFSEQTQRLLQTERIHRAASILHPAAVKLQIAFPDKTLLQYDCGKLQILAGMLKRLQAGGHRVLIFTQMTKMLDILELFLSHAGYRYSRLDGSTKVEDRLLVTERFNNNPRIFAFIASTRSGGVGINLTGADTVIFYDNEFNPAMDKQAMDRAHRIGQTREVNIYRLVTRHTVEENMLKKANQKRLLDDVVMQEGNFTTDYLTNNASKGKSDLRDLLGEDTYDSLQMDRLQQRGDASGNRTRSNSVATVDEREMQHALEQVQDTEDIDAGREAAKEIELDDTDFNVEYDTNQDPGFPASTQGTPKNSRSASATARSHVDGTLVDGRPTDKEIGHEEHGEGGVGQDAGSEDEEMEDDAGAIDDYMLRLVEWDWSYFV